MAYSTDLRSRLVKSALAGGSARALAKVFQVSDSTAIKWVRAWHQEGRDAPKPGAGGNASPIGAHADWLLARVREEPDITLKEMEEELAQKGLVTSKSALSRFLRGRGLTFKKKRSGRRAGSRRRGEGA
jgi:transposase